MKFGTGALHIMQLVICEFRENRAKESLLRFKLSTYFKTLWHSESKELLSDMYVTPCNTLSAWRSYTVSTYLQILKLYLLISGAAGFFFDARGASSNNGRP